MTQLRQQAGEFEALNARILVVTFELDYLARAYAESGDLAWPLVVDADRALYTSYGMGSGRWWHVYGPAAWWIYAKLLARGRRLNRAQGDVNQLGGDVLIDPEGVVRLHHVGSGPADRPKISALLSVMRNSASE